MKNIYRMLFICFLFLFALFVDQEVVSARVSSSPVFEVGVGEEKLNIYYELVKDEQNVVRERMIFPVSVKGLETTSNSYRWEHTFCYKIEGKEEVCEIDLTGEDQVVEGEETSKILSNMSYNYTYFDEDMPYYSDSLVFEYITFKNKFVCLDCSESNEIVLNDITFLEDEIDYAYKFNVAVDVYEKNDKQYVSYNNMALFVSSSIVMKETNPIIEIDGSVTFDIVNEMCISETDCFDVRYDIVSVGGVGKKITPYVGNINFPYNSSSKFNNSDASKITFKTTLECTSNCDNNRRMGKSIVIYEKTFDFYGKNPEFDIDNSIISSMNEYKQNIDVKITMKDDFSGLKEGTFKYYLAWENSNGSCPVSSNSYSEYNFENGELFTLGNERTGPTCMYFEAQSNIGNTYKSEYYHLKFDNDKPTINNNHNYDLSKYYNEIVLNPVVRDSYSGIKEVYYLWTKDTITGSTYLRIKEEGKVYSGEVSSLEDISEDGSYNLYFLIYDNAGNYAAYNLYSYNIDTTPLDINDIEVSSNLSDNYNGVGEITVNISEMNTNESFKCGFLNSDSVSVNDLNMNCLNDKSVSLPSSLEGEYSFYVYVRDRANNYGLYEVKQNLKIDTKSPVLEYSILYNDNEYRIVNEITINISDLNDLNVNSMKYGWFLARKNNVVSNDLTNSFENGGKITYPRGNYGEYKLYISVSDVLGNQTFKAINKVFKIDTDIIKINLVGEEKVTVLRGEKYEDAGAKAYKGQLGSSRHSEVRVEGKVDTSKVGVYYLTYSSGEGELEVSVTRKIVVKDDFSYILISSGIFVIGMVFTGVRLFVRRKNGQNV